MSENHIAQPWRRHLAASLHDRYGLSPKDADLKAREWLWRIDIAPAAPLKTSIQRRGNHAITDNLTA